MRVGQAACDLRRIIYGDRFGQPSVGCDDLGERRAVHELHDDVVGIVLASDVVGVDDVRVRELRGRFRFLVEAADELIVGGVLLAQHFDRNATSQQNIGAAVHDAIPPSPSLRSRR